jgi:hypothetical protein
MEKLDVREQYIVLEMSTSKIVHIERKRENTPAKQHQGKA